MSALGRIGTALVSSSAMSETLRGLWLEVRVIPVLLWSFSALTLGTALAAHGRDLDVWFYLGAVALGVLIQGLLAHSVNEVEDWRSGTDRHASPRVISGGSKVIVAGLLSPRALWWVFAGAFAATTVIGLSLVAARRPRPAAVRARGRRRGDPLHAAAGAGGLPAVPGRGDRVHLPGRLRVRRAPAAGARDRLRHRRRRGCRGGVCGVDAHGAPLPRPRRRRRRRPAQGDLDRATSGSSAGAATPSAGAWSRWPRRSPGSAVAAAAAAARRRVHDRAWSHTCAAGPTTSRR